MRTNAALYDQDFYAWTQEQAALLRAGALHDLDVTHLAEEIESLGKSDRRALGSHLRNLVLHLLKWHAQPAGRHPGPSWRQSIRNGVPGATTGFFTVSRVSRQVPWTMVFAFRQ